MNQQTLRRTFLCALGLLVLFLSGCGGTQIPATLYLPPTRSLPTETPTPIPVTIFTPAPDLPLTEAAAAPTTFQDTPQPICENDLSFVSDLTVPDGSIFEPGATIDKRWRVENSGTCNWDSRYRLRFILGDAMGTTVEQLLFPARAGTQTEIAILFTAPDEPGVYRSEWQAYGADGAPFGDPIYMEVVVQSP